jgi:hypothetical protein
MKAELIFIVLVTLATSASAFAGQTASAGTGCQEGLCSVAQLANVE